MTHRVRGVRCSRVIWLQIGQLRLIAGLFPDRPRRASRRVSSSSTGLGALPQPAANRYLKPPATSREISYLVAKLPGPGNQEPSIPQATVYRVILPEPKALKFRTVRIPHLRSVSLLPLPCRSRRVWACPQTRCGTFRLESWVDQNEPKASRDGSRCSGSGQPVGESQACYLD